MTKSCWTLGLAGCATPPLAVSPGLKCPEPTPAMLWELSLGQIPPATRDYLGRVELVCRILAR